jgi:hypothetical protein
MQITYDSSRIRGLKPADRILVEGSDDGGRTFYWHPKEMTVAKWRRGFRFKHDAGRLFTAFRAWPHRPPRGESTSLGR